MKFSFKKIGSILASTAMLSSTVALAAAANFPAPFVSGGAANAAIVHGGANAAYTDLVAVTDISSYLSTELAKQTATGTSTAGGASTTGETAPLFTSSKKIYLNDSINKEKSLLTKSNLPTVLGDGTFQGDVTATYTQKIELSDTTGINNKLAFGQHPTSDNDPVYAFDLGTTSGTSMYNLTVSFSKAVAFNNSDSEGSTIRLFGTDFTIGSDTDGTNLILLKSSEKLSLSSDDPSAEVEVAGKTYTIELVSASDTSATVKVTDSTGASDSKEITEDKSKTIKGLEVGVTAADETNLKLSATVIVGSDKVKLTDNNAVKLGSDERTLDGTNVRFGDNGNQRPNNITKIIFQSATKDTNVDALTQGGEFIDPIFGSLKMSFAGMTYPSDSASRENIKVSGSGSDKASVTFKSWEATEEKSIDFYLNKTGTIRADGYTATGFAALGDSSDYAINVFERLPINKSEYVVVGNENNGGLWKLQTVSNDTSIATSSTIEFKNVLTNAVQKATISADGTGTIDLSGRTYTVDYIDNRNTEGDEVVRLRYIDGSKSTANNAVIYPTIQTSQGAKLFFYEPMTINLSSWDNTGGVRGSSTANNLSVLKFPDGDGYTSITVTPLASGEISGNYTIAGDQFNSTVAAGAVNEPNFAIGQLTYNVTRVTADVGRVFLLDQASAYITTPAIVIFEEKDDSSSQVYEAVVVKMEGGGTSSTKVGVSDVETTWGKDAQFDEIQVKSNTKLYKSADFFGTLITTDQSDSDAYSATISYPDQQNYALIYMGEVTSAITAAGGTSGAGGVTSLGSVAVTDSEVSSVGGKNLIVVGGSCVNTVAANLLGVSARTCGSAFTEKTGIGSGQFLIETFARTGGNVATLVAGYNAGDTTNAAKALTTQIIDTTAGKKYKGTSSTAVEAVMVDNA